LKLRTVTEEPAIESNRVMVKHTKLRVEENVVLIGVPPGLLDGLPKDAQRAIRAIVGKPVMLVGFDDGGRAELYFADPFAVQTEESSHAHTICG
jgi:hypothetical protein